MGFCSLQLDTQSSSFQSQSKLNQQAGKKSQLQFEKAQEIMMIMSYLKSLVGKSHLLQ